MIHKHSIAALIAALAVSAATPALATTFDVTVWQGTGAGSGSDPTQQALPSNPLSGGTAVASFEYTGTVDWTAANQATNTLSQFVATGGGSITNCSGADCNGANALKSGVLLSNGGYGLTTLMELTFTTSGPISGTITHDDGTSLYDVTNTLAYVSDAQPTVAVATSYSLASAGTYHLWYDEANGAPSDLNLQVNSVPEPGTLGLLGFSAMGLFGLRRRAARRA